jgi:hypothetical protein
MPPWLSAFGRFLLQALLFILGALLVLIALTVWLTPETATLTTVTDKTTVKVEGPSAASPTVNANPPQTAPAPAASSQTTTTTTDKKTETSTPPASKRSDVLLASLLAIGSAGVLASLFFNRIKSIKVAGVELELQASLAAKIAAKTTPKTEIEKQKVQLAYSRAVEAASALGVSPTDDAALELVADAALHTAFSGNPPPP